MYWFARELFDGIQSSPTASSVLKQKLLFLVSIFSAQCADIALSEVNPTYVTARYHCMTTQDGFWMNLSLHKMLLTSFRIFFNFACMEAGQKQAAGSVQQAFQHFANSRKLKILCTFQSIILIVILTCNQELSILLHLDCLSTVIVMLT